MKIICGLGNPGNAYSGTRHNVGFWVVAALADRLRAEFSKTKFLSRYAEAAIGDAKLMILKPKTYMNQSGRAVAAALSFHDIKPAELLVVHDDLDLAVGAMRLKSRGGTGGHKGVASIVQEIGTDSFARLKIGIGRPSSGMDPTDYVLAKPNAADRLVLERAVERAVEAIEIVLEKGLGPAMNIFNKPPEGADEAGPDEQNAQQ